MCSIISVAVAESLQNTKQPDARMTDPKFANLPGIAYDQPDVYETGDDVSETTSDFYEEESECIERLHISTRDSINRFRGKYLTGPIDFSDRIGTRSRTGYDSRTSEWELAGDGERETPIQRCRRLQCEMEELMQDLAAIQADGTVSREDKESYETVGQVVNNARKVLDSLRLEQILGKETVAANADSEVRQLMQQIEEYKKTGDLKKVVFVGGAGPNAGAPSAAAGELMQTSRIAQLEHRLHQLEKAVGAKPEKLSRLAASLGTETLLDGIQQLSTRAALLQPSQLDLIEVRLDNLATKMDTIAEKKTAAGQDAGREQKTLELYEIAKRTEPITQLLPDMLNRMQALESLHSYATNFSKIIAEQAECQQNLAANLTNNKQLLQGVQDAFAVNLVNVNNEQAKLEQRLKQLSAQVDKQ